jgi:hypothetical protein
MPNSVRKQVTASEVAVEASAGSPAYLGLLDLDVGRIISHLRRDLRDDWFPDVLNYSDSLTAEFMCSRLTELQQDPLRGYLATERIVRDIPKPGGGLRYSLETTLADRFVYQALVEELARPLDALQSTHVFSHRCQLEDRRGFFKPAVPQWSLFRDALRENGRDRWIVEADLQNFYESISLEELRKTLLQGISEAEGNFREKARRRYAVDMLLQLLPVWCYAPTHGLPQNRDASSFLANQYMRNIDLEMEGLYPFYFRYMDDIRICVESRDEARRALVALTVSLRRIGLSLNSKKTKIYQPGSPDHIDITSPEDERFHKIDSMWRSRSQSVIARSVSYIAELARELVSEEATDSRKFRFCVNRLQKLAQADLSVEIPCRDEIKELIFARIVEDASAADLLCSFLGAIGLAPEECRRLELLLLDSGIYLYEWQRYQMVLLLLDQGYSSPELLSACESEIQCGPREGIPRDLALVVLAKYGGQNARQEIAEAYGRVCRTHIEQRAGIVAVHELPYRDGVDKNVKPNVPVALRGMFREIKKKHAGTYCLRLPKLAPSDLIDVVSAYV